MPAVSRSLIPAVNPRSITMKIDGWAGFSSVMDGRGVEPNRPRDIMNLRYVKSKKRIGLRPRGGLEKLSTNGAAGAAAKDIGFYLDTSGVLHYLQVSGSALYELASGTYSKIADLESTRGRMVQLGNNLVVFDGSYLKYYDGTSLEYAYDAEAPMLEVTDGDRTNAISILDTIPKAGVRFTTGGWDSAYKLPITKAIFWLSKEEPGHTSFWTANSQHENGDFAIPTTTSVMTVEEALETVDEMTETLDELDAVAGYLNRYYEALNVGFTGENEPGWPSEVGDTVDEEVSAVHDSDYESAAYYAGGTSFANGAATFGITETDENLSSLKTLTGDALYKITVTDDGGKTATGYIRNVLVSGDNYTLKVWNTQAGAAQSWVREGGFNSSAAAYTWEILPVPVTWRCVGLNACEGDAVCKLYKASDNSLIATSDAVDSADGIEAAGGRVEFTFTASGRVVEPNTEYDLVVEFPDGDSGQYLVLEHFSTTTEDGVTILYNEGDSAWVEGSQNVYFELYPALPPKSSFGEIQADRLLINDEDTPSRGRYSQVNTVLEWSGSGAGFLQRIVEGSKITAIKPFFKGLAFHFGADGPKVIYLLTGTSPDSYDMQRLNSEVAAISQDVCLPLDNDQIFLDETGPYSLTSINSFGDAKSGYLGEDVEDQFEENIAATAFASRCGGHQQVWFDLGMAHQLVLHPGKLWSQYQFALGGNTVTAMAELNGVVYLGDSAGHMYKYDPNNAVYTDSGNSYVPITYVKNAWWDAGFEAVKRSRFVVVEAAGDNGGAFDVALYDENNDTVAVTTVFFDEDSKQALAKACKLPRKARMKFMELSAGLENIDPKAGRLIISKVAVEASLLTRFWR